MAPLSLDALRDEMRAETDLLIVQDLDGVCMPLVKDPLTRTLRADYVEAAAGMQNRFSVLTNGEHEGCLLYTSPSPRDRTRSRMPSSA